MALNPRKVLEVLEEAQFAWGGEGVSVYCPSCNAKPLQHHPDCPLLAQITACRAELDPEFSASLPRVGEE